MNYRTAFAECNVFSAQGKACRMKSCPDLSARCPLTGWRARAAAAMIALNPDRRVPCWNYVLTVNSAIKICRRPRLMRASARLSARFALTVRKACWRSTARTVRVSWYGGRYVRRRRCCAIRLQLSDIMFLRHPAKFASAIGLIAGA